MTRDKEDTAREANPTQPWPDWASPRNSTLSGSADLLLVLDDSGRIREISPSVTRLLAYRRSQLLGTAFPEILHPDDVSVLQSLVSAVQKKPDEPMRVQLRARQADGGWRSFEVLARVVPGANRLPLVVLEAYDLSASQPGVASAPPGLQLGGQFAQLADQTDKGDDRPVDEMPSPDLIERAGARGETILVALDERAVSTLACSIMRHLGYTVLEAMSPADAEGFAQVHKGTIHLLVADLATPRVRGRAFVQSMQTIRPGLKSLFVSCHRYGSLAERRVFESGARLLHEPFTPEELAHAVRRAIESKND